MRKRKGYQMPPIASTLDSKLNTSEAFTQIYISYQAYVLSYLRTYHINQQQAEDLAQEVFLKVYLHMDQVQDIVNIRGWLRQIAHNTFVSNFRKQKIQDIHYSEHLTSISCLPCENDAGFTMIEWLDVLHRAVGACSIDYWLILWSFAGYSSKEMAAMLGISSQSVRHRLYRLRKRMQASVPNR